MSRVDDDCFEIRRDRDEDQTSECDCAGSDQKEEIVPLVRLENVGRRHNPTARSSVIVFLDALPLWPAGGRACTSESVRLGCLFQGSTKGADMK
jgi:hypothetical protein